MKTICFAYFADGKFIGWYSDSFGTISKTSPKLYTYSEKQVGVVMNNFRSKMEAINETSFEEAKEKAVTLGQSLSLLKFSSEDTLRGKNVELKIVECPVYDGPNPDFDEEAYRKLVEERRVIFDNALPKHLSDGPSAERTKFVEAFDIVYPRPKRDNWIYADYSKVKEWAEKEPTEFLNV